MADKEIQQFQWQRSHKISNGTEGTGSQLNRNVSNTDLLDTYGIQLAVWRSLLPPHLGMNCCATYSYCYWQFSEMLRFFSERRLYESMEALARWTWIWPPLEIYFRGDYNIIGIAALKMTIFRDSCQQRVTSVNILFPVTSTNGAKKYKAPPFASSVYKCSSRRKVKLQEQPKVLLLIFLEEVNLEGKWILF
jgi:hypothetical protein